MKITKLTKKQESQIPLYIDKWVKQASTPMNHEKAIEYTKKLYKSMNEEEPIIVFGFSPMNTALLCSLFFTLVKDKNFFKQLDLQLYSQLHSQLSSQLYSQLGSQLYSQLRSQLHSQLHSQLYSQLGSQLYSQLHSQLHSQLSSQLDSQLYSQLYSQLKDINQNWYLGLWWLVWCGWYEYGKSIGVEFDKGSYDLFINFNSEVHFIIPYKHIAFISEKPVEICWKNKLLHNDKGLAVKYSDNYGLYCLNGVRVTKEIVETPAQELNANLVVKEKNAEVRREIVRKIGVERVCQKLNAKVIDKKGDYELLNLDLGENRIRPYLKMKNPSIGTFHIEGVHPDCKTIDSALEWRNGTKELPTILT